MSTCFFCRLDCCGCGLVVFLMFLCNSYLFRRIGLVSGAAESDSFNYDFEHIDGKLRHGRFQPHGQAFAGQRPLWLVSFVETFHGAYFVGRCERAEQHFRTGRVAHDGIDGVAFGRVAHVGNPLLRESVEHRVIEFRLNDFFLLVGVDVLSEGAPGAGAVNRFAVG